MDNSPLDELMAVARDPAAPLARRIRPLRPLRVAQVTATFPPYHGGTGNVCYHNAVELVKLLIVSYKRHDQNNETHAMCGMV